MELDHKGRDANWLNDEFIKHSNECKDSIRAVFPQQAEELLKMELVKYAIQKFFEDRIERGDFE